MERAEVTVFCIFLAALPRAIGVDQGSMRHRIRRRKIEPCWARAGFDHVGLAEGPALLRKRPQIGDHIIAIRFSGKPDKGHLAVRHEALGIGEIGIEELGRPDAARRGQFLETTRIGVTGGRSNSSTDDPVEHGADRMLGARSDKMTRPAGLENLSAVRGVTASVHDRDRRARAQERDRRPCNEPLSDTYELPIEAPPSSASPPTVRAFSQHRPFQLTIARVPGGVLLRGRTGAGSLGALLDDSFAAETPSSDLAPTTIASAASVDAA